MLKEELTTEEEGTDYYDFMARMGVPYFHFGGMESTLELASRCNINQSTEVLAVGCGTGYSAIYLAKTYGCKVVGIDISKDMIERAQTRNKEEGFTDLVEFYVADAYNLPFEANRFDVVITEFVSIFLEKERVLQEYARVLKPGGRLGVNELYRANEIPQEPMEIITKAETKLTKAIRLPFYFPTLNQWEQWFTQAGLEGVHSYTVPNKYSIKEYIAAAGGNIKVVKMVLRSIYHMLFNSKMRKRLTMMGTSKNVILRNKKTRDYLGSLICIGVKPK